MAYSKETYDLAEIFATDRNLFNDMVDDGIVTPIEKDLMAGNFGDSNFSELAEELPVVMLGNKPYGPKHGYDGYNGDTYETANQYDEVKPQKSYFNTEKGKIMNKLNGGGAFADYTKKRFDKDVSMGDKLRMVIPGYAEGELAYIVTFPFNHKPFMDNLEQQLDKLESSDKRCCPSFSHTSWNTCDDIDVFYISDRIKDLSTYISGPFLKILENNQK
jgi:hypothetical protein